MEALFLLAEKIVVQMKSSFFNEKKSVGNYFFEECIITDSSFKIAFSNREIRLLFYLSLHHLDMPYQIEVSLIKDNQKTNFNNLMRDEKKCESVYNAFPNLLKDPNGLGEELAREIANDLIHYLKLKAV